jgi:hypothetical protein
MRVARQRVTQPVAYMRADLADCLRAVARRTLHDFDSKGSDRARDTWHSSRASRLPWRPAVDADTISERHSCVRPNQRQTVTRLPPKLRTTALLVLTGHSKREILWLLRMNEPALRQRIADIRRRWRAEGDGSLDGISGLSGPLNFGIIRRALLPAARRPGVMLASHDPDGHLFVVSTSRKPGVRQLGSGSNHLRE